MTLSITAFSITTNKCNTQHNGRVLLSCVSSILSVLNKPFMLSVVKLSIVKLSIVKLSIVKLSVVKLSIMVLVQMPRHMTITGVNNCSYKFQPKSF